MLDDKVHPVDNDAAVYAWRSQHNHCQCCGVPEAEARRRDGGITLSVHHIVKFKRSDELCNLLCLCYRCHECAENRTVKDPDTGEQLPLLKLGVCLTLKVVREEDQADFGRLQRLYGKSLPDPEPIPTYFQKMFCSYQHRGDCCCTDDLSSK